MGRKKLNRIQKIILFWILFIIAITIAFFVCKNQILRVLGTTDFFNKAFGKPTPEWLAKKIEKVMPPESEEVDLTQEDFDYDERYLIVEEKQPHGLKKMTDIETFDKSLLEALEPLTKTKPQFPTVDENARNIAAKELEEAYENSTAGYDVEKKEDVVFEKQEVQSEQPQKKVEEENTEAQKEDLPKTKLLLCFILIDGNGSVNRTEVERSVVRTTTPLTIALNELLKGPTYEETQKGYLSLIPDGTRLLSAKIANKTATLSFSDEFLQNKYGVEGYIGQLEQIVYTATTFSSIDNVQFLIEGQKIDYLGGEGIWIGSPLSRNAFR